MSIVDNYHLVRGQLPQGTRLVAVSKYHPVEALREVYDAGCRCFGESHVQELQVKRPQLPADIEWHFIGHLQTNKVKYIAPYISMIHAVDTPRLLQEIHKQARRYQREIPCLLELHVAQEATKYGFEPEACMQFLAEGEWRQWQGARICGIMCMASNVDNESRIEADFEQARTFFLEAKKRFFADDPAFCECSWGMSHDYALAIRHGSTLVRVGSKIFGDRVY